MSRLLPAVAIAALLAGTAAIAQTTPPGDTTPSPTPSPPSVTAPTAPPTAPPEKMPGSDVSSPSGDHTMTDAEAKTWIDKAVYSSDDSNVGSVAAIQRDASGRVTAIHADIGGFLGIGTTRVKIMPSQFKLSEDRVVLDLTAEQVKQLPKAEQ